MTIKLSEGSLKRILEGEIIDKPVLQILGYKKIPGSSNNERYRLMVSDAIICHPFAMLATQLNDKIVRGELERFTVIQLDKYLCNQVQADKKVLILLELTVLANGVDIGEKIGSPMQSSVTMSSNEPQTHQPQANQNFNFGARAPSTATSIKSEDGMPTLRSIPGRGYGYGQQPMQPQGSDSSNLNIHPISSLTPYQNRVITKSHYHLWRVQILKDGHNVVMGDHSSSGQLWTIRARVTNKSTVRTWSNSRGEGKLFSMDLLDESGEIRATAFNDQCDKFYDMIDTNKVYYISKANLKTANKNFTSIKNDYEMSFTPDTTVVPCTESANSIPMLQFDFVTINQLQNVEKDKLVDVIGVCKSATDVQTLTSRTTNRELKKRDIHLVDKSGTEITLTLWGQEAERFNDHDNPVVAVKCARVTDFSGKSLSLLNSSTLQINPDIQEAHVLRGWYDREGSNIATQSLSAQSSGLGGGTWKTFAQVKAEMQGRDDKPDYYTTKATVVMVKRDKCMYMACPGEQCNKQVIDMNNGMYRCEKCNREYGNFKWRLLLSISLADFSENHWVTCFQEVAESLLGMTSAELGTLKETNEDKFSEIIASANFKSFIFKLRTKMETYNEETRPKTTVMSATPVNSQEYANKLLSDIKQMEAVL